MEKVLILGSRGMLGGQLSKVFGSKAVCWDREDFDFTKIDEYRERIELLRPSVVFNCVAYNDVDGAESRPDLAKALNEEGVEKLAALCSDLGLVLVHFSTNYVFGGRQEPYLESDVPDPVSVYGRSKAGGERAALLKNSKTYIVRTAVLFGPKGLSELSKTSFVDLMLDLADKTATIKAVEDEVNSLTNVSDLAIKVKEIIESGKPYGIYHIINQGEASWFEFAREIFKINGKKVGLLPVPSSQFPRAAKRPGKSVLSNTKLEPMRRWQEALKEYLNSSK